MTRLAPSHWIPGRRDSLPPISRRVLIGGALALAFAAVAVLWASAGSHGEAQLARLSDEQRSALYARTLADLELCATAGDALGDHCAHQAKLIAEFPQCDAPCRKLAGTWHAVPTR
jgi:hypothetical protein